MRPRQGRIHYATPRASQDPFCVRARASGARTELLLGLCRPLSARLGHCRPLSRMLAIVAHAGRGGPLLASVVHAMARHCRPWLAMAIVCRGTPGQTTKAPQPDNGLTMAADTDQLAEPPTRRANHGFGDGRQLWAAKLG